MKTLTFFIYLDACRFDYVSEANMPHVFQMATEGSIHRSRTVTGFTQGAAMLTGKYPSETGHFTWYRYSPETSPFTWLTPFGSLRALPRFRYYDPFKVTIRLVSRLITHGKYPDPAHIPLDLLPLFERVSPDMLKESTLISLCQASGKSCLDLMFNFDFIGSKSCEDLTNHARNTIENGTPRDLYLIHIGDLDILGHKYGPRPAAFHSRLLQIDSCIEGLHRSASEHGYKCNFVIASDHGMYNIIDALNVEVPLRSLNLKLHEDYLYFLDSTVARFWYFNEKARQRITQMLSSLPHGHLLTHEEEKEHHIPFEDNSYGDLFFWADKGYIFFPNFFQSSQRNLPLGMHGYLDDDDGTLLIYSEDRQVGMSDTDPIPLVRVFSVVRELAEF